MYLFLASSALVAQLLMSFLFVCFFETQTTIAREQNEKEHKMAAQKIKRTCPPPLHARCPPPCQRAVCLSFFVFFLLLFVSAFFLLILVLQITCVEILNSCESSFFGMLAYYFFSVMCVARNWKLELLLDRKSVV